MYGDSRMYVYADPMCNGLTFGHPSLDFGSFTLREFVELAAGVRSRQVKTTSSLKLNIPQRAHII